MKKKPGTIEAMLDEIRKAISRCNASEKECYEELVGEAEGWQMRLEELEDVDGEEI